MRWEVENALYCDGSLKRVCCTHSFARDRKFQKKNNMGSRKMQNQSVDSESVKKIVKKIFHNKVISKIEYEFMWFLMFKSSQPASFFRLCRFVMFSMDFKSASNLAFFDTHIEF
jgi:hypothetical protein